MSGRLTDVERLERAMKEAELESFLFGGRESLAYFLGWEEVHVRPGLRADGRWRTTTSGSMAAWPDHVLVRVRDRRLMFVELKAELGKVSPEQERVLEVLGSLAGEWLRPLARSIGPVDPAGSWAEEHAMAILRVDVAVWRPSDFRAPLEESAGYQLLR